MVRRKINTKDAQGDNEKAGKKTAELGKKLIWQEQCQRNLTSEQRERMTVGVNVVVAPLA